MGLGAIAGVVPFPRRYLCIYSTTCTWPAQTPDSRTRSTARDVGLLNCLQVVWWSDGGVLGLAWPPIRLETALLGLVSEGSSRLLLLPPPPSRLSRSLCATYILNQTNQPNNMPPQSEQISSDQIGRAWPRSVCVQPTQPAPTVRVQFIPSTAPTSAQ
jgi:hypothetical protein